MTTPDIQYVVYYLDEGKPEVVWEVHHQASAVCNAPHAFMYGYWIADEENPNQRNFVEANEKTRNQIKRWTIDKIKNEIAPNPNLVEVYDSEADMLGEFMLNAL
jgi:hypothetical protein